MTKEQLNIKGLIKADLKIATDNADSIVKAEKLMAAYHTQQAIEKTIKLKASVLGINLWGHDIRKLLDECGKMGILDCLEVPKLIKKNADMYTKWEADSRYYPSTAVNRNSIWAAVRVCGEWLESGVTKGSKLTK